MSDMISRIAESMEIDEALMGAASAPQAVAVARKLYNILTDAGMQVGLQGDQVQIMQDGHKFSVQVQYAGPSLADDMNAPEVDGTVGSDPLDGNMSDEPSETSQLGIDELGGGTL